MVVFGRIGTARNLWRRLALGLFLVLTVPITWAQNYNVSDTVTEYSMKGTFYHNKFEGRKTSNGEIFNQNLFTAAHWKIKLGTYVLVTNKNTGLQVIVKINDRCPRRGVIDMTRRAANGIGIRGCQPVTVRILPDGYQALCEAQDQEFDSVNSRFTSTTFPPPPPVVKTEKEPKEAQEPTPRKESVASATHTTHLASTEQRYNLLIGAAQTHGEAFSMIQKLPDIYQDKAIIDSTSENYITVTIDVRLTQKKAQELNRALKHTFNGCQIVPTE